MLSTRVENLTVEKERRKQSPSGAQSGVEREPKSTRGLEPKDYPTAQEGETKYYVV